MSVEQADYRIDYMVVVHRSPDGWPEEQAMCVVTGSIEDTYNFENDFKNGQSGLRKIISNEVSREVFSKLREKFKKGGF